MRIPKVGTTLACLKNKKQVQVVWFRKLGGEAEIKVEEVGRGCSHIAI